MIDNASKGAPYQLINATSKCFGDSKDDPTEHFLFSSRFCGARSTGYCPTIEYLDGTLDLANSMAMSGAAVSPVVTGNPLLIAVMFVLNLRLGQWMPTPVTKRAFGRPTLLQLAVDSLRKTKRGFTFISDGGHHENLGLEALLARRCRVIIVSDATCDVDHSFSDFAKVYRRSRVYDGIQFFDLATGGLATLDGLTLDEARDTKARNTKAHTISMGIRYPDGSIGVLLYVKPSLTGDEGLDMERYREENPEYPHQPTSDQLFDESQYESYRQLGFHIGESAVASQFGTHLWDCGANERLDVLLRPFATPEWPAERLHNNRSSEQSDGAMLSALGEFGDADWNVRRRAVHKIDGTEEAIEVIRKLAASLSNPDERIVLRAIECLGHFRKSSKHAWRPLVRETERRENTIRRAAANGLRSLGHSNKTVRAALEAADQEYRVR